MSNMVYTKYPLSFSESEISVYANQKVPIWPSMIKSSGNEYLMSTSGKHLSRFPSSLLKVLRASWVTTNKGLLEVLSDFLPMFSYVPYLFIYFADSDWLPFAVRNFGNECDCILSPVHPHSKLLSLEMVLGTINIINSMHYRYICGWICYKVVVTEKISNHAHKKKIIRKIQLYIKILMLWTWTSCLKRGEESYH